MVVEFEPLALRFHGPPALRYLYSCAEGWWQRELDAYRHLLLRFSAAFPCSRSSTLTRRSMHGDRVRITCMALMVIVFESLELLLGLAWRTGLLGESR